MIESLRRSLKMKRTVLFPLVDAALSFLPLAAAIAQEHPEHPKTDKPKAISVNDLEQAIKADIAEKSKATNGIFKLNDPELKKTWDLTLDRVHKDRLSKLSAD